MKSDPNIERLRAIVRPIVVLYCTVILSVLAIMQAAGVGMPPPGCQRRYRYCLYRNHRYCYHRVRHRAWYQALQGER